MSNSTTLSSLSMLKVSIDSGKDYLEYLRPYVLQVLVESPPEVVTDSSVATRLRTLCGLEIPNRTVQIMLQRLARSGYLRKEQGTYRILKEIPIYDSSTARAEAARNISSVVEALIAFAADSAKRTLTEDAATESIVTFLSQFSIPCLKFYLRGTTLPVVNGQSDWQIILVSQFVNQLTLKPELFESFMKFVQGNMLANALCCPDLQSVTKQYDDVIFYLDTPLLLQLLGLEGIQKKEAIEELVALVQQLEGKLAYFAHTFEELVNAIRVSADFIDSQEGRGTIVEEARKSGSTRSDLVLISQNAADILSAKKLLVRPTPPYDIKTHKFEISEDVFAGVLRDEVNYNNPRAREYDVKSVRSVYVLRRGTLPFSIEKASAVLVTNNADFSKAAYEYGKRYEQSQEVSTVITDFSLANTAWLKAPQGAPSLPRKEVLSFAYAALRPSTEFWTKVLKEADRLEALGRISSRDHQLLRSSHNVQSELMKLTLGEDKALTDESITSTLTRVSDEIRAEVSEQLRKSEASRIMVQQTLAAALSNAETIKKRIYWRCDLKAKREAVALSILVYLVQGAVAYFGVVKIAEDSNFGWVMVAVAVLSGVLRIAGARWDIKAGKVGLAFGEWRRKALLKAEYKALSIVDQ
jgi:hypothetical protein